MSFVAYTRLSLARMTFILFAIQERDGGHSVNPFYSTRFIERGGALKRKKLSQALSRKSTLEIDAYCGLPPALIR